MNLLHRGSFKTTLRAANWAALVYNNLKFNCDVI